VLLYCLGALRESDSKVVDVAQLVVTAILGLAGLWFAYSFTRQQRLEIAKRRLDAYRKLWECMQVASPSRKTTQDDNPLSAGEALQVLAEMRAWYYRDGLGMFLPHDTQQMFLEAQKRLKAYAKKPTATCSDRMIRDLSLLRTQMKSDTKIYGADVDRTLEDGDAEFLRAAKIEKARWLRPRYRWFASPSYWAEHQQIKAQRSDVSHPNGV
jgi:hypothetical protein